MTSLTSTEVREVQLTEQEIWFGYRGRISAGQYWGRFALMWAGSFILAIGLANLSEEALGLAAIALLVLGTWIGTAMAWKRLQDQGKSGAMFFLVFIPLVGPIVWLVLSLQRGTHGENQYGPRSGYRYR